MNPSIIVNVTLLSRNRRATVVRAARRMAPTGEEIAEKLWTQVDTFRGDERQLDELLGALRRRATNERISTCNTRTANL